MTTVINLSELIKRGEESKIINFNKDFSSTLSLCFIISKYISDNQRKKILVACLKNSFKNLSSLLGL